MAAQQPVKIKQFVKSVILSVCISGTAVNVPFAAKSVLTTGMMSDALSVIYHAVTDGRMANVNSAKKNVRTIGTSVHVISVL